MKSAGWYRQRNDTIAALRKAGMSVKAIAERYQLSRWRVYTILKEYAILDSYNAKQR